MNYTCTFLSLSVRVDQFYLYLFPFVSHFQFSPEFIFNLRLFFRIYNPRIFNTAFSKFIQIPSKERPVVTFTYLHKIYLIRNNKLHWQRRFLKNIQIRVCLNFLYNFYNILRNVHVSEKRTSFSLDSRVVVSELQQTWNSDFLNMYPVSKMYIRSTYESYLVNNVLTNNLQRLECFEGHSAGWP